MILFLWTHPRSVSTAFERNVAERGDFEILHEPFSDLYYGYEKKAAAQGFRTQYEFPASYTNIKSHLQKLFNSGKDYFIKDMAYHCWSHVKSDYNWLRNSKAVFLIRNPEAAIASHYALNNKVSIEEIGYKSLWQLYSLIEQRGEKPLVILSESLTNDPLSTMHSFETYCSISHKPEALQWKKEAPKVWESWSEWHKEAKESSHIENRKKEYKDTIHNNDLLNKYYNFHLPFYKKLKNKAIEIT